MYEQMGEHCKSVGWAVYVNVSYTVSVILTMRVKCQIAAIPFLGTLSYVVIESNEKGIRWTSGAIGPVLEMERDSSGDGTESSRVLIGWQWIPYSEG